MRKLNWIASVFIISVLILSAIAASQANEDTTKEWRSQVTKEGLERVDFIHRAKHSNPAKSTAALTCYKLLGVKWNSPPVNYVINPSNLQGLSANFVTSAISNSAETWDAVTSSELFNNGYTVDYTAQYGVQNFQNAITFGSYSDSNVIGITSIWYSRKTKQIVEFDILFNTRYAWGDATVDPTNMDLQNIATHELGHAVGMNDIYRSSCPAVTMYGYSTEGEIQKRTLEQPDITGLQKMYGA